MQIVLASTSPYRRALLQRLGLTFVCDPPGVDESPQPQEAHAVLAQRLARTKAQAVAARHPHALVIGSDQVAALGTDILGKPGTHEHAVAQLTAASAHVVNFYTGLCVLDTGTGRSHEYLDTTRVHFRRLNTGEIERYLKTEQPYNCTGSFQAEGLGISLFKAVESEDPTALVGLPLISLCRCLRESGVPVP